MAKFVMIPTHLPNLGERHHRTSDASGITFRPTLNEYAANFCEAPQCAGAC